MSDVPYCEKKLLELKEKTFPLALKNGSFLHNGTVLPKSFREIQDKVENFNIRDDDVWICTFPRTGTTWTQEMLWCIAHDLDFEGAKVDLKERFPFLEYPGLIAEERLKRLIPNENPHEWILEEMDSIDKRPSPRFIKTHLAFQLLPRQLREGKTKAKIVYVTRNAKDVCISYFYHGKLLLGYIGSFEEFCELFLADALTFMPFWRHIIGFIDEKDRFDNRILFLKYEDMKADLPSAIDKISDLLEKPRLPPEDMERLTDHLSFEKMKRNRAVNLEDRAIPPHKMYNTDADNTFIRSGKTQQWKTAMTPEMIGKFDKWINEHFDEFPLLSKYIYA